MQTVTNLLRQLGGALVFYTVLPLPQHLNLEFTKIARWATWIGALVGAALSFANMLLGHLPISDFLRAVVITALWIAITGGLHLDGVMDTADGLAVPDPKRRLEVMSDSRTGAFGSIAAILLILLKVGALADLPVTIELWTVPIWGRWAQWLAIVQYPYLKPTGKGAFHRRALKLPHDLGPSLLLFVVVMSTALLRQPHSAFHHLIMSLTGLSIAWGSGAWFNHRLGGMTGDSYGAVTEWTEALMLCSFSLFKNL